MALSAGACPGSPGCPTSARQPAGTVKGVRTGLGGTGYGIHTVSSPSVVVTRQVWAQDLLEMMGWPDTKVNQMSIVNWEAAEGGATNNTATWNPISTTQREPGSKSINSVGVQAYPSMSEGLAATVTTLQNGMYPGIAKSFMSPSNSIGQNEAAIVASPWGTGKGLLSMPTGGQAYALEANAKIGTCTGGNCKPSHSSSGGVSGGGSSSSGSCPGWTNPGGAITCHLDNAVKGILSELARLFMLILGVIVIVVGLVVLARGDEGGEQAPAASPTPTRSGAEDAAMLAA